MKQLSPALLIAMTLLTVGCAATAPSLTAEQAARRGELLRNLRFEVSGGMPPDRKATADRQQVFLSTASEETVAAVAAGIRANGGVQVEVLKSGYEYPDPSTFGSRGATWEGVRYTDPRYPGLGPAIDAHQYGHLFGGPDSTGVDSEEVPTSWERAYRLRNPSAPDVHHHQSRCRPSGESANDAGKFAIDWFGAALALELVIDVDPLEQYRHGMREGHFVAAVQMMACHRAAIATYSASSNPTVRKLTASMLTTIDESVQTTRENAAVFRDLDWTPQADAKSAGERWKFRRKDPLAQSSRLAAAMPSLAALFQEDPATSMPARLSIRADRETIANSYEARACDNAILQEYRIDPSRPLSKAACELASRLKQPPPVASN